jgi:hypothetical protein
VVARRETIEPAFLAAIQHLPPRQRAVLILRDVLGWPATQTPALLAEVVCRPLPHAAHRRQPAAGAGDLRPAAPRPAYYAFAIDVLRIEDGRIAELTAFHNPGLFPAFAPPAALPPARAAADPTSPMPRPPPDRCGKGVRRDLHSHLGHLGSTTVRPATRSPSKPDVAMRVHGNRTLPAFPLSEPGGGGPARVGLDPEVSKSGCPRQSQAIARQDQGRRSR